MRTGVLQWSVFLDAYHTLLSTQGQSNNSIRVGQI